MNVSRHIAWAMVLYYALANWPGGFDPINTGLDDSWIYANNVLFHAGPVFGSEVAFTFGPLGFLLNPRAVEGNLARGLFFWITVHLATVALFVTATRRGRYWQVCGSVALAVLAHVLGVWPEYWFSLSAGFFAISAMLLPGRAWPWALAAGGLAALLAGIKLTSGAGALSMGLLAFALLPASAERRKRMAALAMAATAFTWLPLYFIHFDGLRSFLRWLAWSSEITSGYSAAMSILHQTETLWNALAVALAYAAFFVWGGARQRRLAAVFALVLFVAFRHGYVRQGIHSTAFYGTSCAIPAILFFFTESRRERAAVLAVAAACAMITVYHRGRPNSDLHLQWRSSRDYLSLQKGIRNAGQLVHLKEETVRLEQLGESLARSVMPPGNWPDIMRSDYGQVASLPWEITGLRGAGLPWQLLPSLQLYSAYTAKLDIATAAVFSRANRPKWIWLMNAQIDGRTQFTDNPETWLAILDNYEVIATDGRGNQLLLRSKASGVRTRIGPVVRSSIARAGEWVDIDDMTRLWRVEMDLRPTPWGRLARLVYQWPAVVMEVDRESGGPSRIRILPDTAVNGLLFPLQQGSIAEVAAVVANRPSNRVKRFRILLPKGGYFEESIPLRWRRTSRVFDPPLP